jgi:hypothetical protein
VQRLSNGEAVTAGQAQFAAVSDALWMQREAYSVLLYRLVTERLILGSGSTRWLVDVDAEVCAARERVQLGEIARALEVDVLLAQLGLDGNASLGELADAALQPWRWLLREHRDALLTLTTDVSLTAAQNRRLLDVGPDRVVQAAAVELAYREALRTNAGVAQLSLLEFLR